MKNILILCTGNSCRSQIAEGFLRHFSPKNARIYSAGIEVHGLNPNAIATMLEVGIDISGQTSNLVDEYASINFDYIITVCDHAKEHCPIFPSKAVKVHRDFSDPAKIQGTDEEIRLGFAKARQEIEKFTRAFVSEYLK